MKIEYQILRSRRRTLAIQITAHGQVLVRSPYGISDRSIADFVKRKEGWIAKHLQKTPAVDPLTPEQVKQLKRQAAQVLAERTAYYADLLGVSYGRITVRSQKTRWGSCSAKGNLNFNCLLMLAPPEVRDYVVIHELCHQKEMNHSQRFWEAVSTLCPHHKQRRKWLKANGPALIARLP